MLERADGKQAISVLRRLFLSSMFDRVNGSKRKLLATEKSVTMFDRVDGSKPARGSLLKIEDTLPRCQELNFECFTPARVCLF